jgi:hypothetical protein
MRQRFYPQRKNDNRKNYHTGNPHTFQLPIQIGHGAFLDGIGNFLHLFISGWCAFNDNRNDDGK